MAHRKRATRKDAHQCAGERKRRSSTGYRPGRSLEEEFYGYRSADWFPMDYNLDTSANSSADQHPGPHFRVMNRADESHAYDQLKSAILQRKSESTASRLQRLLTTVELGDQLPSQLLHRMHQLLGEQAFDVSNSILRELFLQRLPQGVRMVLAPANDMSLDRFAEMADRVVEYALPTVAALTEPQSSTTAIQELQAKVDQLTVTPFPTEQLTFRSSAIAVTNSGYLLVPPKRLGARDSDVAHRKWATREDAHQCTGERKEAPRDIARADRSRKASTATPSAGWFP
ncbi:hypothetical protein HPB47_019193, partial [Ixodes persulcatus]